MVDREKRGEDENTKIWISQERKELFRLHLVTSKMLFEYGWFSLQCLIEYNFDNIRIWNERYKSTRNGIIHQ